MRFKANIGMGWLLFCIFVPNFWGQDEEPTFREPLYYSDVDRDQRTPQAVRVGGVVFVAAMSAPGPNLEEQLKTIYIRLQSVLGNYGLRMSDVAQERVYLRTGQSYLVASDARLLVYGEETAPAVSLVEVAGFEDDRTLVEIELIAVANPNVE